MTSVCDFPWRGERFIYVRLPEGRFHSRMKRLPAITGDDRNMPDQNMTNHLRGALIGLAVGDALGAAVEFSSPGSFAPVTGYRSGGPHSLQAGEWTDDTSMALALADSMASAGWDLNDQANRYVEWWKTGKYSVNG